MQIEKPVFRYPTTFEGKPIKLDLRFEHRGEHLQVQISGFPESATGMQMAKAMEPVSLALVEHGLLNNYSHTVMAGTEHFIIPSGMDWQKVVSAALAKIGAKMEMETEEVVTAAEKAREQRAKIVRKFEAALNEMYPDNPTNSRAASKMARVFDELFADMQKDNYRPSTSPGRR